VVVSAGIFNHRRDQAMKRSRRVNKDRMKRLPSVEENLSAHATDDDNPQVTFDVEKAREEMMRGWELNDEYKGAHNAEAACHEEGSRMWKTRKIMVKKVGAGEVKEVDVLPSDTAQQVLSKAGASASMVLTSDPQRAKIFGGDEVLWEFLEEGMQLYAALPTPVGR